MLNRQCGQSKAGKMINVSTGEMSQAITFLTILTSLAVITILLTFMILNSYSWSSGSSLISFIRVIRVLWIYFITFRYFWDDGLPYDKRLWQVVHFRNPGFLAFSKCWRRKATKIEGEATFLRSHSTFFQDEKMRKPFSGWFIYKYQNFWKVMKSFSNSWRTM